MVDPNLELMEIFKDEQDLVCWESLALADFVHDEIEVPYCDLQAQLHQLVSTLWQIILLRIHDRQTHPEREISQVVELAKLLRIRCDRLKRCIKALREFVRHLKRHEITVCLQVEL